MLAMQGTVIAEMTALAHRSQVHLVPTAGVMAEMRRRQYDRPPRPLPRLAMAFSTALWARMGAVQSTLAHTFTLPPSPLKANAPADGLPVSWV